MEQRQWIMTLNESKAFLAVTMLLLNIGAKHIAGEIGSFHNKLLDNDIVKRFILFSLFFVATHDIVLALTLTFVFSCIVYGFFHENSKFTFVKSNPSHHVNTANKSPDVGK
jgi:hypothetical protein